MSQRLVWKHSDMSRLQTLELCLEQWSLAWQRSAVPPPPDRSAHIYIYMWCKRVMYRLKCSVGLKKCELVTFYSADRAALSLSLSLSLAPEQPEAVTSLEILHSGNILIEWMLTCCCWGGLNQDEADRYCVVLVNAADLIGRLTLRLSKSLFKLSVSVYSQKSHWSHDVCPLGTMTIHPNPGRRLDLTRSAPSSCQQCG